jgi:Glycosyltransferase family 87
MKYLKLNLHFLVLGVSALIFLVVGGQRAFRFSHDLVPIYTGAGCLLQGCDPYKTSQLEEQFFQRGGRIVDLPSWEIDMPVYPPSTFLTLSPLLLLRYRSARLFWYLLNGGLFILSAVLVLSACPRSHRWLATILVSLILATSGILLVVGQPATFAISLIIISSYLFLRVRFLPLCAFLFMLSLAVKPQLGGLIVLYFLGQKVYRRYAAFALAGALVLLLSAGLTLQMRPHSANWTSTLQANLSSTLSPGGSADPRPTNQEAIGDINLQSLTSVFFAEAGTFNHVAYLIFLVLVAVLIIVVPWSRASEETHVLALAALSILTLMPVYHRFYDTRLLLLTVPAVILTLEKRQVLGTVIAVLTLLSVISVQYRLQIYLVQHAEWERVLQHKLLFILLLRQQNLELLILFALYLVAIPGIGSSRVRTIDSSSVYQNPIPLNR